jgi:hypothetical protein
MNDVARQVSGALGTAVIGSLIATLYANRIAATCPRSPERLVVVRPIRSVQRTSSQPVYLRTTTPA